MVCVLYTKNIQPLDPFVLNAYLPLLSENQREKLSRFHKWKDAQAFLFGKLLLNHLLKTYHNNYTIRDLKFSDTGKPFISRLFDFNISHSGSYVICAYSDEGKIGIDIELINRKDYEYLISLFTPDEIEEAFIAGSKDLCAAVYNLWTIKEAAIKADGRGMAIPLNEVRIKGSHVFIDEKEWIKEKIYFDSDYAVHLVSKKKLTQQLKMDQIVF